MALCTIDWQISQHLFGVDRTNWNQVMDHFLKVVYAKDLCDFCAYFHGVFWSHTFVVG